MSCPNTLENYKIYSNFSEKKAILNCIIVLILLNIIILSKVCENKKKNNTYPIFQTMSSNVTGFFSMKK